MLSIENLTECSVLGILKLQPHKMSFLCRVTSKGNDKSAVPVLLLRLVAAASVVDVELLFPDALSST